MKFLIIAVAFLACAYADVSELGHGGYDYPAPVHEEVKSEPIVPQNTYLPPPAAPQNTYIPPAPPAPKNTYVPPPAAPQNTYIPPAVHEEVKSEPIAPPQNTYIPPAEAAAPVAEDGYRYRVVRRRVYRHRF